MSLAIDARSDAEVATAFEVLGRIAGGLTCEGIECRIFSFRSDDDGEDGPE